MKRYQQFRDKYRESAYFLLLLQCQKQGRKKNIEKMAVLSQILRYFKNQKDIMEDRLSHLKNMLNRFFLAIFFFNETLK